MNWNILNFAYPWLLSLYLPLLILVIYALRRPKPTIKVSNVKPFQASGKTSFLRLAGTPFWFYILALGILIFALARPRKGTEHLIHRAEGIDIMIAIDLSGSMRAYDVPGNIGSSNQLVQAINNGTLKNRLDVAKEEIKKFIEKRPNDRIGLIAFAPLPYVACPPTLDHGQLFQNLNQLKPGIIGDATGIAGPVASAVHRLKDAESKRRVVVLFTDGSNNVNAKVTPRQAAKLAKTFEVVVYTVGIGSNRAYIVQNNALFGNQIHPYSNEFDEALLRDMADLSDGKYYAAADAEGLEKAMEDINQLEKTTKEQPRFMEYKEWAPRLISVAMLILILGFFLEHSFCLRVP